MDGVADVSVAPALRDHPFTKMSGGGNDFVVLDDRAHWFPRADPDLIESLCRRGTGVGADALLLFDHSERADFRMTYFNADGGRAPMCGNGAMCIARWARRLGHVAGPDIRIDTDAGVVRARVRDPDRPDVTLWLGPPRDLTEALEIDDAGQFERLGYVDTTTPHVVALVSDVSTLDVAREGRRLRSHERFEPAGTNVNFISITDRSSIRMRTYERGVEAETLSCGTGATAAAILAWRWGRVDPPVRVVPPGGYPLEIDFDADVAIAGPRLTGHARIVYEGVFGEIQVDPVSAAG